MQSGGLTAGNDTVDRYVNATSPITVKPVDVMAKNSFGGRAISLSTSWMWDDDFGDETSLDGYVVSGDVMYQSHQWVKKGTGGQVVSSDLTRVGSGWSAFRTLTQSWSLETPGRRMYLGSFERLLTARCGNYGTVLLAIDKDLGAGYLYAVGHANGTATEINSLGKVPATFNDQTDFSWGSVVDAPLFGE